MGKKKKQKGRLPISMAERRLRSIEDVIMDKTSDREALRSAYEELLQMETKYVLPPNYFALRIVAADDLGKEPAEVLRVAETGRERYPDDASIRYNAGQAYLRQGYLLLAMAEFESCLACLHHRDREYVDDDKIRRLINDIDSEMPQAVASLGLTWPDDRDVAVAGERVRRLLERGDYEESARMASEVLEARPEQTPVRNNLARALWEQGSLNKAVGEQKLALEQEPDRPAGVANMVRFCTLTGRFDEAQRWARHAQTLSATSPADVVAFMEAAAFRKDDSWVLRLSESFKLWDAEWTTTLVGAASLLAGTACARSGDTSGAHRWWTHARENAAPEEAKRRLDELSRPEDDRNEPWYFSLREFLPARFMNSLVELSPAQEDDVNPDALTSALLELHPELQDLVPYLLNQGDDISRFIALSVLRHLGTEDSLATVLQLIRENRIRQERKTQAVRLLEMHGSVEVPAPELGAPGRQVEGPQTITVGEYEISFEPMEEPPADIRDLTEEAYHRLEEGRPEEAERLLLKALEIRDDHPPLLQNLAAAYERRGKQRESWELMEQVHQRFPDYAFGRYAEAIRLSGTKGGVEKARQLLQPVTERETFHVTEFTGLCHAMCYVLSEKNDLKGAADWLEMWKTVDPQDERLKQFALLEGYSTLQNLISRGRKPRRDT
ncbi:MAG: tetratricopeptide repeat protein [Spirochaetota bacterium]